MSTQEKDYWDRRYDELFPDGMTQEQTDEANRMMWKGNTFYCGGCNRHVPISEYPHDCPVNQIRSEVLNDSTSGAATNEACKYTNEYIGTRRYHS